MRYQYCLTSCSLLSDLQSPPLLRSTSRICTPAVMERPDYAFGNAALSKRPGNRAVVSLTLMLWTRQATPISLPFLDRRHLFNAAHRGSRVEYAVCFVQQQRGDVVIVYSAGFGLNTMTLLQRTPDECPSSPSYSCLDPRHSSHLQQPRSPDLQSSNGNMTDDNYSPTTDGYSSAQEFLRSTPPSPKHEPGWLAKHEPEMAGLFASMAADNEEFTTKISDLKHPGERRSRKMWHTGTGDLAMEFKSAFDAWDALPAPRRPCMELFLLERGFRGVLDPANAANLMARRRSHLAKQLKDVLERYLVISKRHRLGLDEFFERKGFEGTYLLLASR